MSHEGASSERSYETLRVAVDGPSATVTMHRPDRLNALTPTMARELHSALADIAGRSDVHVVTLTGAGRGFSAGADVDAFRNGEFFDDPLVPEDFRSAALLHEMPQVTVAAVNGGCAGASLALAAACDLRIASTAAVFNLAFLTIGVSGDMAGAWTIPRIVGPARARELFFFPERFSAEQALEIGLVAKVVAEAEFRNAVDEFVATLIGYDPAALRATKRNFLLAERLALSDYLRQESEGVLAAMGAPSAVDCFRKAESLRSASSIQRAPQRH